MSTNSAPRLLDAAALERLSVVADNAMNRDRAGPGYTGQPAVTSYYDW